MPLVLISLMSFDAVQHFDHPHVIMYSYVFDCLMFVGIILVITILQLTFNAAKSSFRLQRNFGNSYGNVRLRKRSVYTVKRKKIRLVVIFILMMIGYVLTFLPLMIGRLLYDAGFIRNLSMDKEVLLVTLLHCFYKSSALLNPFLTIFRKHDYRKTLVSFIGTLVRTLVKRQE